MMSSEVKYDFTFSPSSPGGPAMPGGPMKPFKEKKKKYIDALHFFFFYLLLHWVLLKHDKKMQQETREQLGWKLQTAETENSWAETESKSLQGDAGVRWLGSGV